MKQIVHRISAITATLCISVFFTSTIAIELFGTTEAIATVKSLIVMPGLFILILAIAATGVTGFAMTKGSNKGLIGNKRKRMPFIGVNGLLILLPAAIVLDQWATAGSFDTRFYLLQGLELAAGAINLTLMFLNICDGRKIKGK
jgi:hypothetical protein